MQQVLGYSAIEAGLAYLPLAVTIIVVSGVSSQLVTKIGFKPTLAIGMAMIAAVSGVREQESGLASGLINTSQQIGGALGLAVLATVATSRTEDLLAAGGGRPEALTEGFQLAFLGGAAIAAVGLVSTLILIRSSDSRAHVRLGDEGLAGAEA